jgi:hypothetical protein
LPDCMIIDSANTNSISLSRKQSLPSKAIEEGYLYRAGQESILEVLERNNSTDERRVEVQVSGLRELSCLALEFRAV